MTRDHAAQHAGAVSASLPPNLTCVGEGRGLPMSGPQHSVSRQPRGNDFCPHEPQRPRARRRSFGKAHCPEASVPTFQSTLHRLKKPVSRFKPHACLACANPQPAAIQPISPQPHVARSATTTISSIRKPCPASQHKPLPWPTTHPASFPNARWPSPRRHSPAASTRSPRKPAARLYLRHRLRQPPRRETVSNTPTLVKK